MSMNQSIEVRAPFASQNFRKNFLLFTNNGHFNSKYNKPLIRSNYSNELDETIIGNYKKQAGQLLKIGFYLMNIKRYY